MFALLARGRRTAVILGSFAAFATVACSAATSDEGPVGETQEELRTSYVYACSLTSADRDRGFDERVYLRVSGARVRWNATNDFGSGAQVATRDTDYSAPESSPDYARYASGDDDWRLSPKMLHGGASVPEDLLGGAAI